MDDKIYVAILQIDDDKTGVIATAYTSDQAFDAAQRFLRVNPNVKASQISVKEYLFKKELKMLDYQE